MTENGRGWKDRKRRRKYKYRISLTSNKHLNTFVSLELQLFLSKSILVFSTEQWCYSGVCWTPGCSCRRPQREVQCALFRTEKQVTAVGRWPARWFHVQQSCTARTEESRLTGKLQPGLKGLPFLQGPGCGDALLQARESAPEASLADKRKPYFRANEQRNWLLK